MEKAAEIRKTNLGEAHPDYLRLMNEVATIQKNLGNYSEALRILKQVTEIWRFLEGENSEAYATALGAYSLTLLNVGDYTTAETHLLQLEKLRRRINGTNHNEYAVVCSGLGILYLSIAQYDKAEAYLLHSLDYYERNSGPKDVAVSKSNLGYLYFLIGQYDKARNEYLGSQELVRQTGDTLTNEYATLMGNMGVLFIETEEYERALACVETASEIRKDIYGTEHSEYAITLQNLAGVYYYLDQLDKVEPLLKEVLRIYKKTVGDEHPEYATSLGNLATYYYDRKEFKKAAPLLEESLKIREKLYGELHPDFAASLRSMALLNLDLGKPEVAQDYFLRQNESVNKFLLTTLDFLPEQERQDYLEKVIVLDDNSSFLTNYDKSSPEMIISNFEQLLFLKSLSLSSAQGMLQAIRQTTDPGVRNSYGSWLEKKKQLALLVTQGGEENEDEVKNLEKETSDLEKSLMQNSLAFRRQQENREVTIKDVQAKLLDDEAVVEFVRYDYYMTNWTDSVYYGAYVLKKKDSVPVFIQLFEEKQLQVLFDSAGKTAMEQAFSFYRGLERKDGKNAGVIGERLYNILWAPLEPYLKGVRRVSYSPAGLLYNISLNALPVDSNTVLLDKYLLQQFTSSRLIAARGSDRGSSEEGPGIALFGDALFDLVPVSNAEPSGNAGVASLSIRGGREKWNALPGTAEEVEKIYKLFLERKRPARQYLKMQATEENLKNLDGRSPGILHIATHGFFLPAPEKKIEKNSLSSVNSYARSENPLVRSGLVFSGANYAWSGKQVTEGEDGIATAYEISQLDLSNTGLLVLSACETALGDIKGSEGVFGLQRAFKMAGVRKMIVSLWQVPDKETAELMIKFYTYLLSGKPVEESFALAQSDMRKKYSPFYWAAFVLVE
jgi:CHAT domain-containing protein/Flp pilus assembly protein TadD